MHAAKSGKRTHIADATDSVQRLFLGSALTPGARCGGRSGNDQARAAPRSVKV